jgi:hypothetical protein
VKGGALYVYDPDSGTTRRLARGVAGDVAVAPDAGSVAYVGAGGGIAIAGARGGPSHSVLRAGGRYPRWTGRGRLAYVRGGALEERDIGRGRRTTLDRGPIVSPAFRVAGRTLASRGGDLFLGPTRLTRTPRALELPLDYEADLGLLALRVVKDSAELRAYQLGGRSRLLVRLPRSGAADAAWSPHGTELAYIDARGNLRVRAFLTGKERILARGGITAVDW